MNGIIQVIKRGSVWYEKYYLS